MVRELHELIAEGAAALIGTIRQEILSGVRSREHYEILRDHLRASPDLELETADHDKAAEHFTAARSKGVQGSNTDFLLCAVADRRDLPIFTTDRYFESFVGLFPMRLHRARFEE